MDKFTVFNNFFHPSVTPQELEDILRHHQPIVPILVFFILFPLQRDGFFLLFKRIEIAQNQSPPITHYMQLVPQVFL
jgi:hypothetical protein